MNKQVIECERKWLLWTPPRESLIPDLTKNLEYLFSPEGIRFQKETYYSGETNFFKVEKKDSEVKSSREESVISISETEFSNVFVNQGYAYLSKTRRVYDMGEYKAEVDLYHQHTLITMEIEKIFSKDDEYWQHKAHIFESEKFPFMPNEIKSVILAEVTGMEDFKNENLAFKAHNYSKVI